MPTLSVNGDNGVIRMFPCGTLLPYLGLDTPAGYLECNGQAVSRAGYPELFNVLGTTYGEGDGVTTFNLPDFRNRVMQGAETPGTTLEAGLPNITGDIVGWGIGQTAVSDGFTESLRYYGCVGNRIGSSASGAQGHALSTVANNQRNLMHSPHIDASKSNAIYGASNTVQPPAITVRMLVQY